MATIDINRLIQDSIIASQSSQYSSPILENDDMSDVELSLKKVIFEDIDVNEDNKYDFKKFLKNSK